MKNFIYGCLFGLVILGAVVVINFATAQTKETRLVDISAFKATSGKLAEDMQFRFAMIPPQGQLWGFTPDQKLDVTVLQTKATEDGATVAVKITSLATLPKSDVKTPTPTKDSQPVRVELNGIAKLHYELIANQWYLTDITSVNLRATQK